MADIHNVFLRKKAVRLFLEIGRLKNSYIFKISKNIDVTFSYAVGLSKLLERKGLITKEKEGRVKIVTLTGKGIVLHKELEAVDSLLGGSKGV